MVNNILFSIVASIVFFLSLGLNVVTAKNPVYSIFYLVLFFITGSCLIALFGYDYLSLIFILVYVGAIAVLFLFVIMILDIKIINKPTVLHKITSIDFIGHCMILLVIFCLFSPNFFIFNTFLAFFYYCWYFFMLAMWPFFDFINLIEGPLFSTMCLNDPSFIYLISTCTDVFKHFDNFINFHILEIFSFLNALEVYSLLSSYFYKVLYCTYPWDWYFLLNDYKIDYRVTEIILLSEIKGLNICQLTRSCDLSAVECVLDMRCIECVESSRENLLKLSKFILYFKAVEYICSNFMDDTGLSLLDYNNILWVDFDSSVKNLQILYTDFALWFILCGGVLLVAMVSCISLTLPSKQESVLKKPTYKFVNRLKRVVIIDNENYN